MCPIPQQIARSGSDDTTSPAAAGKDSGVSCFTSRRLNGSTFVIIEDDKWREQPFIYAKIYPSALVLIDTGCGGAARDQNTGQTSLREYIETVPLVENGGEPLNAGSSREYVVICTHCHFDHIGGIAQFPEASVWASSLDKSFLARKNLDTTSLCRFVGMQTPRYAVTHWADDGREVTTTGSGGGGGAGGGISKGLNLYIYHAPGHTPDEVAIWDPAERVLFVGDTMYERVAILLPIDGGDVAAYLATVDKLRVLVEGWDAESAAGSPSKKVTMACGHATSAADAAGLLDAVDSFMCRVLLGEIEGESGGKGFHGEPVVAYRDNDDDDDDDGAPGSSRGLNMRAAEKVLAEFRGDEDAMDRLRGRRTRWRLGGDRRSR